MEDHLRIFANGTKGVCRFVGDVWKMRTFVNQHTNFPFDLEGRQISLLPEISALSSFIQKSFAAIVIFL